MRANQPDNKRRKRSLWRLIYISAISAIFIGAIFFSYFIYQNIFAVLSNTYTASILQTTAYIDTVDIPAYDKAKLILEKKNALTEAGQTSTTKNPFIAETNATSTTKSTR